MSLVKILVEHEVSDAACYECSNARDVKNSTADFCTVFHDYVHTEPCAECKAAVKAAKAQ